MDKSLTERDLSPLSNEAQSFLMGQICSLTEKDHPIYNLINKRTQEYVTTFLCLPYPYKRVPLVPGGLTIVQKEIEFIGFHYANIVNFNKQVYGPFYAGIFRKLLFSEVEGGKTEAQA
ncbi:PREDICTED: T-complex protein 11-like protein 2 [Nanorana parkeri]|uniref:T-complex protein 11-like protein 2 n=1 Tax=Nanorana parkeri TaxID=125878 RepID=UPI000854571B|nr:PREDICTED: T-complex protein 11-like protein 2 [Nanorana parkeri]